MSTADRRPFKTFRNGRCFAVQDWSPTALSGTVTLVYTPAVTGQLQVSGTIVRLDPNGASRIVKLPPTAQSAGVELFVHHVGSDDAYVLELQTPAGVSIGALKKGEIAYCYCSTSGTWYVRTFGSLGTGTMLVTGTIPGGTGAGKAGSLFSNPYAVLAAPGSGYFWDVLSCHWFLDYASATYDGAVAGDILTLGYDTGADITDGVAGNTIGGAAADYHTTVLRVPELVPTENKAVVARVASSDWYTAAGNSPLKYEIECRLRTFAL